MKFIGDWEIDYVFTINHVDWEIDVTFKRKIFFIYHRVRIVKYLPNYSSDSLKIKFPVHIFNVTYGSTIKDIYSMEYGIISCLVRLKYRLFNLIFSWSWEDTYSSLDEVDTDKYPFLLKLDIFKNKLRDKKLKEIGI